MEHHSIPLEEHQMYTEMKKTKQKKNKQTNKNKRDFQCTPNKAKGNIGVQLGSTVSVFEIAINPSHTQLLVRPEREFES